MLCISTPCASLNKEIGPGMSDIESWGSNNDIAPKKLSYFLPLPHKAQYFAIYARKLFLLKVWTTNLFHHLRQKYTAELDGLGPQTHNRFMWLIEKGVPDLA